MACCLSLSSWLKLFARVISIGRAPESLTRSSKMVRAGEGGIESTRLKGPTTGLARAEEAEPARDRRSSGNASTSVPEEWDRFHRVDMVERREPMRETPFIDASSERRFFGDGAVSIPVSLRS